MPANLSNIKWLRTGVSLSVFLLCAAAFASDSPKSAEEFAALYIKAFNANDQAALHKLRYPLAGKSNMQEMIDGMTEAELSAGVKYSKFEILAPQPDMDKPSMGPDGLFYQANLKPTNMIKFTSETKDGSSSTTFPVGVKDGIYYQVSIAPAAGETPTYSFGWQRFKAPKSNWSVMLPNEPEPGRIALEKQFGKDALDNPEIYGVVKNTAAIKTSQCWFSCGEEGKRVHDQDNHEIYRAACTTYAPETLKEWFSDTRKNLDDAVSCATRQNEGKLVQQKEIDLAGSPGREFEIHDKDGTLRLGRVYWIKDALYELDFESKKEKPDLASANKFFTSLKFD